MTPIARNSLIAVTVVLVLAGLGYLTYYMLNKYYKRPVGDIGSLSTGTYTNVSDDSWTMEINDTPSSAPYADLTDNASGAVLFKKSGTIMLDGLWYKGDDRIYFNSKTKSDTQHGLGGQLFKYLNGDLEYVPPSGIQVPVAGMRFHLKS